MSAIYDALWSISDDLRGAIDSFDFKNYVLGTMFYRYIKPERFKAVLQSEQVADTLKQDFEEIETDTGCIGLFADYDVSSPKLGNTPEKREERLKKLLKGVSLMEYENDALGDAYEYLMSMYASNGGKSGGEYFTPPEVSELLTMLGALKAPAKPKVYDPSCGSGSLLLKAIKVLGAGKVKGLYGQEINRTTYNLCRMNMLIHGAEFEIACEDTLLKPQLQEYAPYELIVSNPPYSVKWAGGGKPELKEDPRYKPAGALAPKSKGDLAFVMHVLSYLAENGIALIVVFPGVLYRGQAEQQIRKYLVENNFVDSVIQLPENLFYGTSISTSILVLRKQKADRRILFIDASREYETGTNKNRLSASSMKKIMHAFEGRQEVEDYCALVENEKVLAEGYNLSVSTYVSQNQPQAPIDIKELNEQLRELTRTHYLINCALDDFVAEIERELK